MIYQKNNPPRIFVGPTCKLQLLYLFSHPVPPSRHQQHHPFHHGWSTYPNLTYMEGFKGGGGGRLTSHTSHNIRRYFAPPASQSSRSVRNHPRDRTTQPKCLCSKKNAKTHPSEPNNPPFKGRTTTVYLLYR